MAQQNNLFYDISAVKQIPILSVADQLGVSVQKRGRNFWCKVRDEANPSVVLHPDKNTFYDFGNQAHGDVIRFVQYARDIPSGAAIRYLGETFGLKPNMTRQQLVNRPLTNWEYSQIGLHGDMATKNLVFPIETATMDQLCELSLHYQMSLNELQKQYPELYRRVVKQKAIPYVEELRNCYHLDIWNHFSLTYAMGDNSISLYRSREVRERFEKDTSALNRAERILYRACRNAGLDAPEPPKHDPVNVIRQFLQGKLPITLGNTDAKSLSHLARETGCRVCESTVPCHSYFDDRLQAFPHAAVYQAGKITLQYLSSDSAAISPVLDALRSAPDIPLKQQISPSNVERQPQDTPAKKSQKTLEIY